jgi:hypothetical protein
MLIIGSLFVLGLVSFGIATIETADKVEVKMRRLNRYTRKPLDPFQ